MSSPLEIMQAAQKFDPYGSFREGQMQATQYDIKQMGLEEQARELKQEQEQAQAQPTGGTVPVGQQAKIAYPNWKLSDDNGMPTVAGQINDYTVQSFAAVKDSEKLLRQARFETDPVRKERLTSEGRRLRDEAMKFKKSASDLANKTQNDAIYGLATAANQSEWDNIIKGWEKNGFPIPQGFPTEYSAENLKKVQQMAPAELQSKINTDLRKREAEKRSELKQNLEIKKLQAQERDGFKSNGGMRSAIIEQRQDTLAVNATEFVRTLQNITDLPAESSSGVFGGKTAGSLFTAPVEAAANTLTSDSVQRYNSEMGGLGNHLAWMVSGGLSPSVSVQEKFDSILKIKEGDSQATVLTKLARARQEAENVLAVKMKSRLMSDEMKDMLKGLDDDLKRTIPFTVSDVNKWSNAKDKKETFGKFMERTVGKSTGGSEAPPAESKPEAKTPPAKSRVETVTVGGKTYSRPAGMSDTDWNDYKSAVGAL